eukprot:RCo028234
MPPFPNKVPSALSHSLSISSLRKSVRPDIQIPYSLSYILSSSTMTLFDTGCPPITPIIEGQLYLGDRVAAADLDLLRSFGVTHVVNAALEQPSFHFDELVYYNCNLLDIFFERIKFEGPLAFIQEALDQGGVVFVHCMQGKSRSASLVIAYVMRAYGMSLDDALAKVQELRSCVQPNSGFMKQLREFELTLPHGQQWKVAGGADIEDEDEDGEEEEYDGNTSPAVYAPSAPQPFWQATVEYSEDGVYGGVRAW